MVLSIVAPQRLQLWDRVGPGFVVNTVVVWVADACEGGLGPGAFVGLLVVGVQWGLPYCCWVHWCKLNFLPRAQSGSCSRRLEFF